MFKKQAAASVFLFAIIVSGANGGRLFDVVPVDEPAFTPRDKASTSHGNQGGKKKKRKQGRDQNDSCKSIKAKASKIEKTVVPIDATCITQADFEQGSLIIATAGDYKLCEDIVFGPLGPKDGDLPSDDAFDPKIDDIYKDNEFGMGFFAAICIACSDVTLHLNGFKIEQSKGHALMQRFFALIELASSPFIPDVGPANFVSDKFMPAVNVKILGPGTIGRSSHHGIHGNENVNVTISGITFEDFEVAAVSLNNVNNLEISQNTITKNRQDIPITGMFSALRFIRPYVQQLADEGYEMDLYNSKNGTINTATAAEVYGDVIATINNVYQDVIYGDGYIDEKLHPAEHHLFNNPFKVVDGPCYVFLVHGKGPAVGGQGQSLNANANLTSSNVVIKDNQVKNIKCWNNEVPALFGNCGGGVGCVANDARGSIFQTIKTFGERTDLAMGEDGKYNGNPVSNAQIMVAKAISDGYLDDKRSRQIGPNSIPEEVSQWAQDGSVLKPNYVCNGDSMHHVIKGSIIFRVEDTAGFNIKRNTIKHVENLSFPPFQNCTLNHVGASPENKDEYQAGNIRAISIAAAGGYENDYSYVTDNVIHDLTSEQANVIIGIDVQGESAMTEIKGNTIDIQKDLGEDPEDHCIAVRVRTNVDASVGIQCNNLDQEAQVLNSETDIAEIPGHVGLIADAIVELPELAGLMAAGIVELPGHVGLKADGIVDWVTGGCPFAADYANIKV